MDVDKQINMVIIAKNSIGLYSVAFADVGRTEIPWTKRPYKDSSGIDVFAVCIADNKK